jgi:hypothetical protein
MRLPIVLGLLASTVLIGPHAKASPVTFSDGTFNLAGYSISTGLENGGASSTPTQCSNCGNPSGLGLQIAGDFPNAPTPPNLFTTVQVLLNNAFIYTPSTQGAITNLSAFTDKNLSVDIALTGGGNTFHPTVLQGGVLYVDSIAGPGLNCPAGACSTGYNTIGGTGLTAADFPQFDPATDTFGTGTPDFTSSGSQITFGLTQIFGAGAAEVIVADYDNLSIAINAVPEPASFAILGVGLLGLLEVRRRRAG